MDNRQRRIQLKFRVTEQERDLIEQKKRQVGTINTEAYLRKMAIDGYVVKLDLSEVKELVSLLRRCSNNLNQYTKRAHETGSIYATDIEDLSYRWMGYGRWRGTYSRRSASCENGNKCSCCGGRNGIVAPCFLRAFLIDT